MTSWLVRSSTTESRAGWKPLRHSILRCEFMLGKFFIYFLNDSNSWAPRDSIYECWFIESRSMRVKTWKGRAQGSWIEAKLQMEFSSEKPSQPWHKLSMTTRLLAEGDSIVLKSFRVSLLGKCRRDIFIPNIQHEMFFFLLRSDANHPMVFWLWSCCEEHIYIRKLWHHATWRRGSFPRGARNSSGGGIFDA